MRRPFLAGNWKMNLTRNEARALASELRELCSGVTDRDIGLFPTFVSLADVSEICDGSNISVGAQNCFMKDDGAFTGELSPNILKSVGTTHVILGHSERRHILGETDDAINMKVHAALQNGIDVILCVGETLDERQADRTEAVVGRQVTGGLKDVAKDDMPRMTVAYEPVWAIGTGQVATPDQAQEMHAAIRAMVESLYDRAVAQDLRIQYGGSVKPDNVDGLMGMPDIDGALVGGAALDAASFGRIVKFNA